MTPRRRSKSRCLSKASGFDATTANIPSGINNPEGDVSKNPEFYVMVSFATNDSTWCSWRCLAGVTLNICCRCYSFFTGPRVLLLIDIRLKTSDRISCIVQVLQVGSHKFLSGAFLTPTKISIHKISHRTWRVKHNDHAIHMHRDMHTPIFRKKSCC